MPATASETPRLTDLSAQETVHVAVRAMLTALAARRASTDIGADRALVLAVSGGCDSMVLLDAVAAVTSGSRADALRPAPLPQTSSRPSRTGEASR